MTTIGQQASGAATLLAIFQAADAAVAAVEREATGLETEVRRSLGDKLGQAVIEAGRDWLRERDGER